MTPIDASPAPESRVVSIVLAAGKSTRMRSRLPKTLHPICGRPLLSHILHALDSAGVSRRILIVGHQAETVRAQMDASFGPGTLLYAEQTDQRGTGHAAQMAHPLLRDFDGCVLVLPGDAPLLSADVLRELIATHESAGASATVLTALLPDALSYGRILRDVSTGEITGIIEAKDATPEQRQIREINAGVYAFDSRSLFDALQEIRSDNAQGELYLTDVIAILKKSGKRVQAMISPDSDVTLGVNTRVELAEIATRMRQKILRAHMLNGVTIEDPATTYIDADVEVGIDTTIAPNTHLRAGTVIGEECVIGPNSILEQSQIGDRTKVVGSYLEGAIVGNDCRIYPMARLRPGAVLGDGCKIGNFVEIKNARLGEHVSAGHLSYIGDAVVGSNTNIGAGTITCNYDGYAKHETSIGSNAFIGSHTTLVAPVTVGNGVLTAAGSVITQSVSDNSLAIARSQQINKEGWAQRRRDLMKARQESTQGTTSPEDSPKAH